MKKHKLNGNQKKDQASAAMNQEELKFPISYHLKAIFILPEKKEFYMDELAKAFDSLLIEHKLQNEKFSKKGNYVSFTYLVHLDNRVQMEKMYEALKMIEGLKFAL
ncbi:MAG: DUF493 domain-containing protein [Bacteroidales bacterium]|nr:DUF493 domain-containing protein [Bacteroidales bacterium]